MFPLLGEVYIISKVLWCMFPESSVNLFSVFIETNMIQSNGISAVHVYATDCGVCVG